MGIYDDGIRSKFYLSRIMSTTTIAIDPGENGGVAFHNERDGIYLAHNLKPLTDFLESIDTIRNADYKIVFVVEDVPPYTGNNIPGSSAFKMGVSYGLIQGIALGERIPCFKITPKDWQKGLQGITGKKGKDRKQILKDICKRLYPELTPTLKTCDAILILHQYLRCKELGK